ncbi:ATP phosphoribosyltransferase regulatory subunit [Fuchsiella alkaliacetigena]|uniref:ATP phosphoribosyltransferase regulatory subunit n=1 Tax=Fuchsiella alkaliacetigena TaxID=957042 RepID=UPI00200B3607|nr:ATP phosphoribosyltransferase regulatory subunit [Fuchsiella alkaliacetigena]MCK8824243.1 ATP phosphoribosyltransferase regulatory subunit [Fuchsiella alkaliacetigena]
MERDLTFNKMQTPSGTKDYLPAEAKKKRYLEEQIISLFSEWGYQEVITPTFEFFSALSIGTGSELQEKMYKFFNRQGEIMALRPEMTAPIARLVTNRFSGQEIPLRLSYLANVFRYEAPLAGRKREFYQAGVELIGCEESLADAEIIALAIEALERVGLKNFSLDIGQVDYFMGLMEKMELEPEVKSKLKKCLTKKDFVALENLVSNTALSDSEQEAILSLPKLRGGKEIIKQAKELIVNGKSQAALESLEDIYQQLEELGVAEQVTLDLSTLRGLDYYTGIVFEGYTNDLGFTICGGGRYDNLLGEFGEPNPAIGFSVGIDRLILSLENQGVKLPTVEEDTFIFYAKDYRQQAIELARRLRQKGEQVVLEVKERSVAASIDYAQQKEMGRIIYLGTVDEINNWDYQLETLFGQEVVIIE